VYVISKGRISSVRSASRRAPHASPLLGQIETINDESESESRISCSKLSFKGLFLQTNLVLFVTFFMKSHICMHAIAAGNRALKPSSWQGESMK